MNHPLPLPSWTAGAYHSGATPYLSELYPALGARVAVQMRAPAAAPLRAVYLRTFPDGEQMLTPMRRADATAEAQWWLGNLTISEPLVHYRFLLEADDGLWWLTARGVTAHDPLDLTDFRIIADYVAPTWVREAVFYQIFPDRFANGDPTTDPQPAEFAFRGARPHTYPWGTPPDPDQPFSLVFYGGDLPGIVERLDYVQELGVSALYLTPVFTAHSNHKYDVIDYERVDPHLGGDAALAALRAALTARGMRYLLDIVPNHCGVLHPWFQAAQRDAAAPTAEFFTFHEHPDRYESWLGVWALPKLDYRSVALRRRMYEDREAVFRRWLRPPCAADGWRVDVANMLGRQGASQLGPQINQAIRRAVKETNPDAYLLGENFFDASPQLQGDQFDGVMNYMGFSKPLIFWLTGYTVTAWGLADAVHSAVPWPTAALIATWQERLAAIPWQIALQQYNLLGSHDTPRIQTLVGGQRPLHQLAAVVQFAFPGVPGVYYGDEIGMTDDALLRQRGCMVWDSADWDHDLRAFYRRLIALRRRSAALQTGSFQVIAVEADGFAFVRAAPQETALVVANRHPAGRPAGPLAVASAGLGDGVQFVEAFGGQTAVVRNGALDLPALPQGATLWEARN